MNRRHYNRCRLIQEAFAQAVEQLFANEYLETLSPEKINVSICDILQCLNDKEVKEYISSTPSSYEKSQQGEFSYTGQYWMTYVGLVDLLHYAIKFHYAIAPTMFIIFSDILMDEQILFSPQMKRSVIISDKHGI